MRCHTPPYRERMRTVVVPEVLPGAIARSRALVEAVLAESLAETGADGPVALAWEWGLTGSRPSPITLSLPVGRPPSREEILAEADADPEIRSGSLGEPTAGDQVWQAALILRWLAGASDEIPVAQEDRGRFIGARDDYARTDAEIRQVRDWAELGLRESGDLPVPMDPDDATRPWSWDAGWMNAAWLRGVRDFLTWVAGERADAPLSGRVERLPSLTLATWEDSYAEDVLLQGRPGGHVVQPGRYPPPQYGEAIQECIQWLDGRSIRPPVDQHGCGAYVACPDDGPRCTCPVGGRCLLQGCEVCASEPCLTSVHEMTDHLRRGDA